MTEFFTRAATPADAYAIHQLVAACQRDLAGPSEVSLDGIVASLARPGLDLARDTLLLHDPAGELVGSGWVHLGRRAEIDVHPGHRDRGLGTRLLDWAEARARELGSERIGQNIRDDDPRAAALLRAHGYRPKATAWLLGIPLAEEPALPELSEGITVRPFRYSGVDGRPGAARSGDEWAAYQLVEAAFGEWRERRYPYEEWAGLTIDRDTFVPELSPLAFAGDQLVGAVLSLDRPDSPDGYVHTVATRRDHRNRGIARALLRYAFRGFHRRGRRGCTLWTHSETGALGLYQRVGMTVRSSSTHYSKPLEAG